MSGADFNPGEATKATQCASVLAALREGPKGTADLFRLGMLSPSKRIHECRRAGARIRTVRNGANCLYVLDEVQA